MGMHTVGFFESGFVVMVDRGVSLEPLQTGSDESGQNWIQIVQIPIFQPLVLF